MKYARQSNVPTVIDGVSLLSANLHVTLN